MSMNKRQTKKVIDSFAQGTDSFTESDLEKVKTQGEKAEALASNLGEQYESFKLLWQILKDYWSGNYNNIPWRFVSAIGFAVAYLISPVDIIPDLLPIVGFIDDAAVFALIIKGFEADIQAYKDWKDKQ